MNLKEKFLAEIKNQPVHRVDLNAAGQKNTRDYAYGIAHYSVGPDFKAEVVFFDKKEEVATAVLIKNKTFNTVVAQFKHPDCISEFVRALDSAALINKLSKKQVEYKQSVELNRLANAGTFTKVK